MACDHVEILPLRVTNPGYGRDGLGNRRTREGETVHSSEVAEVVSITQAERRKEAAEASLARMARDHRRRANRSSRRGLGDWLEHGARRIAARVATL